MKCKDRWNRQHYDMVSFRCGKGGRDMIRHIATANGMSLAEYLRHLIIQDVASRTDVSTGAKADISAILGGGGDNSKIANVIQSLTFRSIRIL